jgi:hypothetical protein
MGIILKKLFFVTAIFGFKSLSQLHASLLVTLSTPIRRASDRIVIAAPYHILEFPNDQLQLTGVNFPWNSVRGTDTKASSVIESVSLSTRRIRAIHRLGPPLVGGLGPVHMTPLFMILPVHSLVSCTTIAGGMASGTFLDLVVTTGRFLFTTTIILVFVPLGVAAYHTAVLEI